MNDTNYLNLYKTFLVKQLMRSTCIHAKDALSSVNKFVNTHEGTQGFINWCDKQLSLHADKKPLPIKKLVEKIEDDLDPIMKQKEI